MLRITVAETATEQRWTLEGRLVGPWVGELRTCWKKRHRSQNGRGCTVDLSEVTFIDKGGQRLLRTMSREDTQFICTSVYINHVLDQFTLRTCLLLLASSYAAVAMAMSSSRKCGELLSLPRDTHDEFVQSQKQKL
jgi:ABC-type transporter Mla MlaB component